MKKLMIITILFISTNGMSQQSNSIGLEIGLHKTNNYYYGGLPVVRKTLLETPNDGVVLKPSQMAFPGCPDMYKRALNEIYDKTTGTFIQVPHTVNHMQMRNCSETDAALRKIYEGNGVDMPEFFRLYKW